MPSIIGTILTILIVAGLAALAVRSLWRKRGSGCNCGKCAACGGCARKEGAKRE